VTIKVRPIYGDHPGRCEVIHDNDRCDEEAAVIASIPVPGLTQTRVDVLFCRQDWAEVVESEELDLRKTIAAQYPVDENGNLHPGGFPIPDND
jgi:hypothetical protein